MSVIMNIIMWEYAVQRCKCFILPFPFLSHAHTTLSVFTLSATCSFLVYNWPAFSSSQLREPSVAVRDALPPLLHLQRGTRRRRRRLRPVSGYSRTSQNLACQLGLTNNNNKKKKFSVTKGEKKRGIREKAIRFRLFSCSQYLSLLEEVLASSFAGVSPFLVYHPRRSGLHLFSAAYLSLL